MKLGTPDQAEAIDLTRHVDRCAMRYRLFTKRLRMQGNQVSRVEIILYSLALYEVFSNGPIHDFVKWFITK